MNTLASSLHTRGCGGSAARKQRQTMVLVFFIVLSAGGGLNTSESKRGLLERLNVKVAMEMLMIVTGCIS